MLPLNWTMLHNRKKPGSAAVAPPGRVTRSDKKLTQGKISDFMRRPSTRGKSSTGSLDRESSVTTGSSSKPSSDVAEEDEDEDAEDDDKEEEEDAEEEEEDAEEEEEEEEEPKEKVKASAGSRRQTPSSSSSRATSPTKKKSAANTSKTKTNTRCVSDCLLSYFNYCIYFWYLVFVAYTHTHTYLHAYITITIPTWLLWLKHLPLPSLALHFGTNSLLWYGPPY